MIIITAIVYSPVNEQYTLHYKAAGDYFCIGITEVDAKVMLQEIPYTERRRESEFGYYIHYILSTDEDLRDSTKQKKSCLVCGCTCGIKAGK